MKQPVISISDLTVVLTGRTILKDVSLDIYNGEVLAVMGLSGVGKSTLLKCIIGLLKPVKGQIKVLGQEVTGMNEKELNEVRRQVGMVFQSPALFDSLTIEENVGFGLREHYHLSQAEIRSRVKEKLDLVELSNIEKLYPSQLSGGMQKRASLARSIITDPKIVLYDEPTTGLDPIMVTVINTLILNLKEKLGASSIIVTHDVDSAKKVADRIAMIYGGRIVEVGEVNKFVESENPIVQQFLHGSMEGPIKV